MFAEDGQLTQWFLLENKEDGVNQFHVFGEVIELDNVSGGVHSRKV